jgi:hypothetical protein
LVLASKLNHWSMLLALKWNRWSLHLACHFENVAVTLGVGVHPCAPVAVAELEESNHQGNLEWQVWHYNLEWQAWHYNLEWQVWQ